MTRLTYGRATSSSWGYLPVLAARREGWRYEQGPERNESAAPKSTAEWISLAVSLIILSGFVGAIIWLWIHQPTGPAQFNVQRGVIRNETGLFHLPVTVTNTGGSAVGQVRVEGKLNNQGQEELRL